MFSKLALFFVAAFMAVFAVALPHPGGEGGIVSSCNGGTVQCCNSYQPASSNAVQSKARELGIVGALVPVAGSVGLTCTPVNVLLSQGTSCQAQNVCCMGNNFSNGAVVMGCNPISLGGI